MRSIDSSTRIVAARRASGAAGDDVLGALLAAGLDDAEVRDHLVTLVAAGHETTAGSLAWALERLARAPSALERIRSGDEAWLGAVIRETLRIRPVLTVAPRKLAAPLQVGAHRLPAGVHVAPCIYLVHRRSDLYPDPAALGPGALAGRRAPAVLRVDPVRRRRAPLPGRRVRDDGDGGGAARGGRASCPRAGRGARRADAPPRDHAAARPRRPRGAQRFVLSVLRVGSSCRCPALSVASSENSCVPTGSFVSFTVKRVDAVRRAVNVRVR